MTNIKEKLIKLIQTSVGGCARYWAELIADHLVANGVTVQDRKPLEEFLHPIDAYKGLKAKYLVFKADTGEMVNNCFILRPDKDAAAVEALRAYANATDNETLAEDIYNWVGKGEPAQKWIPVTERLPNEAGKYLVVVKSCLGDGDTYIRLLWYGHGFHYCDPDIGDVQMNRYVTHWMPLPAAPEVN